jgi:hypothetical protein
VVLGESFVAHLPQSKQVLDDVEGVFDLGADAGFELLAELLHAARFGARQVLAFARTHGDEPSDLGLGHLFAFIHALIAGISMPVLLLSVKQCMRLGDIMDVPRSAHDGMDQTRVGIDTDVGAFMPKCH